MDALEQAAIRRAQSALHLISANDGDARRARNYVRSIIARAISYAGIDTRSPPVIARAIWGEHEGEAVAKAASAAVTGTQTAEAGAFFGLAGEASILGRLPLRQWPFLVRTLASSGIAGGEVAEGEATPIRIPGLAPFRLTPRKFQAAVIATRESLERGGDAVEQGLQNDLIQAAADAADAVFVADLIAAEDSSGFAGDHRFAVYLMHPQDAAARADEKLNNAGGEYLGYPCFVSNAVPPGAAVFFDASKVAANLGSGEVDFSAHGLLEADTAPSNDSTTPTAATLVSLFQTNTVAIRATMEADWHIEAGAVEVVALGS